MNTRNGNLVNLVTLALLMALIFLMGQTPLGLIPLGFCNVTLLVIPVAVGTLFMGLKYGVLLGLTFGATSFVSALLRPSTLVGTLMGASLPMVIVMTFLPRLMVPVVIHFVHKAMAHKLEKTGLAVGAGPRRRPGPARRAGSASTMDLTLANWRASASDEPPNFKTLSMEFIPLRPRSAQAARAGRPFGKIHRRRTPRGRCTRG